TDVLGVHAGLVDVVVEVVEVEAPLLADHLDGDVGFLGDVLDLGHVARGVVEEHADHEQRQHDVHDLERDVVAELDGQPLVTLALAVDHDAPDHQAPRDRADDEQRDPRVDPQVGDPTRLVGDLSVLVAGHPAATDLGGTASENDREGRHDAQQLRCATDPAGGGSLQVLTSPVPSRTGVRGARLTRDHRPDRKSTRLNSSHVKISYAVFCLKKKKLQKKNEQSTHNY